MADENTQNPELTAEEKAAAKAAEKEAAKAAKEAEKAAAKAAKDADKVELPESVTLARPYGYINEEEGTSHAWAAEQVVKDPEQIADLMARKAPLVGVTYDE